MPRAVIFTSYRDYEIISEGREEELQAFMEQLQVKVAEALAMSPESVSLFWSPYLVGWNMPDLEVGLLGSTEGGATLTREKLERAAQEVKGWLISEGFFGLRSYAAWGRPQPGGKYFYGTSPE